MKIILSPAKRLDFSTPWKYKEHSQPLFLQEAEQWIDYLRQFQPAELQSVMGLSPALAQLNFERYHTWQKEHSPQTAKPAILAYRGDVYEGLKAYDMSLASYRRLQDSVRIISGLYGLLRPFDLIQPYRLEMKTPLASSFANSLYDFWKNRITQTLKKELEQDANPFVVNLASKEYSKVIDWKQLNAKVITPVFKENKGNTYKVVAIYAKHARGLMTRFIVENQLQHPEEIKTFDLEGYLFHDGLSTDNEYIFVRG